jgi:hypothetical protein
MHNTYAATEMQGGVPRCRRETTRMRPRARGYDCISCVGLCRQHLSQRAPQTEHVVPSYGCSKLGEISAQTALFTMIPANLEQSYPNATRSVWGALGRIRGLHDPGRAMALQPCLLAARLRRNARTRPCTPTALHNARAQVTNIILPPPPYAFSQPGRLFMRINHRAPKVAQPRCRMALPYHSTI